MSNLTAPGFAIRRNGTCLPGFETDCGQTRAPFHGCCPMEYACPHQYNLACCPSGQNCTSSLLDPSATPEVRCSNATWDLFDNGGYFCCEHGMKAYDKTSSNVCAGSNYTPANDEMPLVALKLGTTAASQATKSSSTSLLASATASHTEGVSSGGPSMPVGAIVGGVVGGIAAVAIVAILAWFSLRRRKQQVYSQYTKQQGHELQYQGVRYSQKDQPYIHEAPDDRIHEVGGGAIKELPAQERPAELPASHR